MTFYVTDEEPLMQRLLEIRPRTTSRANRINTNTRTITQTEQDYDSETSTSENSNNPSGQSVKESANRNKLQ